MLDLGIWGPPDRVRWPTGHPRILALYAGWRSRRMVHSAGLRASKRSGARGEPGGTRAMGACEPGQGGNAAAISITPMCAGAPPRLTPTPARRGPADGRSRGAESHDPTERVTWPEPLGTRKV